MINTIAEAIKYASQNGTQIIIATHSPLLLNQFDMEDLWIFEKNMDNETIISSIAEADIELGNVWTQSLHNNLKH